MGELTTSQVSAPNRIVAGICAALFVGLGAAIHRGHTKQADERLREGQSHPRRGPRRAFAHTVKQVGRPEVQLAVATIATVALRRARVRGANTVLSTAVIVFLVDRACKHLIARRRPAGYRGAKKYESFPSGHTAATAGLCYSLAGVLGNAGLVPPALASGVAGVLTAAVGESRLILDEHWPSDVAAGAALGRGIAALHLAAR